MIGGMSDDTHIHQQADHAHTVNQIGMGNSNDHA